MTYQPLPTSKAMTAPRPSPTMSATQFAVGRQLVGNDGNIWEVTATSAGVHRWVKAKHVQSGTFHPSAFNIPSTQISNISIDPNAQQSFKYKQNNMSKVKSITKKSTQEVRTIDTSLINKEEVFKMLALAESTGLPCLLIGSPGVAKTKTIIDKITPKPKLNMIWYIELDNYDGMNRQIMEAKKIWSDFQRFYFR